MIYNTHYNSGEEEGITRRYRYEFSLLQNNIYLLIFKKFIIVALDFDYY